MKIAPNGALNSDGTIANTYALVAAVYRQAIKDARRGDKEAIRFLNVTCPDWQELATPSSIKRTGSAPLHATPGVVLDCTLNVN